MEKKKASKVLNNRITYIILSVIVACCLWLYVVSVENPEVEANISNIPVTFSGEEELLADRGFMLSSGKDSYVTLRVRTTRSVLQKLDRRNITVSVDVSGITAAGDYQRTFTIIWPDGVSENDVSVVSRSPSSISFSVARQASKSVELRGTLADGCVVAEGYIAEEFEFSPETVTIRGAEEIISEVAYAQVEISRTNIDQTIDTTSTYTLMDKNGEVIDMEGITLETEEVNVRLPIIQKKQIWLRVDLNDGGGATDSDVKVSIEPEYITVAGDPDVLSTYNSITLASIDLYDVIDSTTETYPIVLINDVKNISGETEAKVTVEIKGLVTRSIEIDDFELINIPDGYYARAETNRLSVNVRGKESAVSQLLAGNIVAVADLSDLNEGTMSVPVDIIINVKTDAGVVGDYSIYVTITDEPPDG